MGKRAFRKSRKFIARFKISDLRRMPDMRGGCNCLRRVEIKDSERHEIWDLLRRLAVLPEQAATAARAEITLPIFGRCKTQRTSARNAESLHRCVCPCAHRPATEPTANRAVAVTSVEDVGDFEPHVTAITASLEDLTHVDPRQIAKLINRMLNPKRLSSVARGQTFHSRRS